LDLLRLLLVYIILFFGLGWLVIPILFKGDDFSFLDRCAIAFSLSVGTISVLGTAFYFLNNDLSVVQSSLLILLVVVFLVRAVGWWRGRKSGKDSNNRRRRVMGRLASFSQPTLIIISFTIFCSLLAFWTGPWLSHTADAFMHMAAVRRLISTGQVLNTGVYFPWESPGLVPQTGTWNLALALLSSFSGMDITRIWLYLPALLTPVYILSFYAFASSLFRNYKLAAFVTVLYFILHHKLDFRVLARPNRISLAILWIALMFTLKYLDTGKKKYLCLASVLGFVLSTMHFFTTELFLLSISSYALFRLLFRLKKGIFSDSDFKRALVVVVITLVLASPFVIFKLASARFTIGPILPADVREAYKRAFRHSLSLGEEFFIVDPAMLFRHPLLFKEMPLPDVGARGELVLFSYLLMFFLIPACLRGKRTETFLFANMAIVPLIIFNPLLLHFIAGRVPDLVIFRLAYEMTPSVLVFGFFLYPWLAGLTRSGDEDFSRTRRREKGWRSRLLPIFLISVSLFCAISSFLGGPVVGGAVAIYNPFSTYRYSVKVSREGRLVSWEEPFSFIMNELPKDAVVLSDPVSSYYIAGLTGRFVIAVPPTHQEANSMRGGPLARRDVMSVLDQDVDLKTTVSLLRKWNADYIFVDLNARGVASLSPRSKFDRYSPNFEKIYNKGDVSIYRYNPAVPFASWDAVAPALHFDSETGVSDDMVLASYSLDEEPIEPNQCAAFTLGWRPMGEIEENRQVEFRFAGINSGQVFSEAFDLVEEAAVMQRSWKPDDVRQETYFVFIPDNVPLDVYDVSVSLSKGGMAQSEVALGRIRLKESYEGENFEGLTHFCERCPGWMRYQGYAVARELGATMSKSIRPIPAGDYQVLLTVYNHEGQGSNQVEVTLNGVSQIVEWSGTEEGEREVNAVFEGQGGGSELTITSLKREQWHIVISEVAIVPR
jgi:predicted permease